MVKEGVRKVNYTKQVREYCEKHANSLVDISIVRDNVFADVPYKKSS